MTPAVRDILFSGPPGWVLRGTVPADLDFDFAKGRYWQRGIGFTADPSAVLSCSRASTGYAQTGEGLWLPFSSNMARITNQGLLVEEARTNDAFWCRDLTNAVWVKVNMTAALTATGIDNTGNAASTLTATAGNATVLQTITLGSISDTYSVFLKRVSGSGTINITENGGTLWTPVALTTLWQRFQVTATLANPVFGIQIVTNGDVVAADFNQLEPGGVATSPIGTTNAAISRAADIVTVANTVVFGSSYTSFGKGTPQATNSAGNQVLVAIDAGSNNNRLLLYRSAGGAHSFNSSAGTGVDINAGTWNQGTLGRFANSSAQGAQAASFNGGAVGTTSGNLPIGVNAVRIGSDVTTANFFNGVISEVAVFANTAQPAAQLQAFGSR